MKKPDFNAALRALAKASLSPNDQERSFVNKVYGAVQACLGTGKCLQIGSFPRFTATTPVHDLDVLYVIGAWRSGDTNPASVLATLESDLRSGFKSPTECDIKISRQTHSITIAFLRAGKEFFAVDVVPAYVFGKNAFGDDMYMVPELLSRSHATRARYYESLGTRQMTWIKSDPRGYIEVAKRIDAANSDFRKTAKFVKAWKYACKAKDENFKLKSFHIEQALTAKFQSQPGLSFYDAVFSFMRDLPMLMRRARFPDRADSAKMIDEYVEALSEAEIRTVTQARDFFLIRLEQVGGAADIAGLLKAGFHERKAGAEAYLFDQGIPVLVEPDVGLRIIAKVLPQSGGFREALLNAVGIIQTGRKIEFRASGHQGRAQLLKWKVKNDDSSREPRGEITDHSTRNDPEHTRFKGHHYVECYAINGGVCVARARQNVVLEQNWA